MIALLFSAVSGIIAVIVATLLYAWAHFLGFSPSTLHIIIAIEAVAIVILMIIEGLATKRAGAGGYAVAIFIIFNILGCLFLLSLKGWSKILSFF